MKNKTDKLLLVIFFIGLSLLLYPSVSNLWNLYHQSHAIAAYTEKVSDLDEDRYQELLKDAKEYNQKLSEKGQRFSLPKKEKAIYEHTLDVSGTGMMGYIEIPSIHVSLPIYHGVDEGTLQVAAGHLDWTSLPVGGKGTHCVLSGHRGLPGAKLFTNLNDLKKGDLFCLRVLRETMAYEVDSILVVKPSEMDSLSIKPEEDLCTLVTCTPYGINSHRLLVRGHRVPYTAETDKLVSGDEIGWDPFLVIPPLVALVLVVGFMLRRIRKRKNYQKKHAKSH